MFLLLWSSDKAQLCAQKLEREFDQPVRIVSSLDQACEELKANVYSAVLVDQLQYESWPGQADFLFQHVGSAAPVVVNFGVSAIDRVVRTVRTSLERRRREMEIARQNACLALNAELKDDLTALFLSCGIGLQDPTLSVHAAEQMRRIEQIGKGIQQKLSVEDARITAAAHA